MDLTGISISHKYFCSPPFKNTVVLLFLGSVTLGVTMYLSLVNKIGETVIHQFQAAILRAGTGFITSIPLFR